MTISARTLGRNGPTVSMEGLGCMSMSPTYGDPDPVEARATILRALDLGVTLLDTANVYGAGHNETIVGEAIVGRRDQVILATKFSLPMDPTSDRGIDGRPENVRASIDASLGRLGTDYVDIYYQHRVDPTVPVEDTIGAMAELVTVGKVRYLGMSEASSSSLERASAVHSIAVLQSEWSLWSRDLETDVLTTARRLGIGIVPYSPLGRGFLTGAITTNQGFGANDARSSLPRFQGENFDKNLQLVTAVRALAEAKGVTPGQLALAWVLAQGDDVVPIPGTKRRKYLEENVAAWDVELTAADIARLEEIAPAGAAAGNRTLPGFQGGYGESPERGRFDRDVNAATSPMTP